MSQDKFDYFMQRTEKDIAEVKSHVEENPPRQEIYEIRTSNKISVTTLGCVWLIRLRNFSDEGMRAARAVSVFPL